MTRLALYIGGTDAIIDTEALSDAGWHVIQPQSVPEALAAYVFYVPSAVIFDADAPDAKTIFEHLSTVTRSTPHTLDVMIVLNNAVSWFTPPQTILTQCVGAADLIGALRAASMERERILGEQMRKIGDV